MRQKNIRIKLAIWIFFILPSLNFAQQMKTENRVPTDLWLSLDITEIKIKDNREPGNDPGEFHFFRKIAGENIRLPESGDITRNENEYIRPADDNLGDEPFWHLTWLEESNSRKIEFDGYESDPWPDSDDYLGAVSATVNIVDFKFITLNKNRKLESEDYDLVFTVTCAPLISSSTHPDSSRSYRKTDVNLSWTRTIPAAGILGYSYLLDVNRGTEPDNILEGTHTSISYTHLSDGIWWFHVKAQDKAGFWSNTGHFKVNINSSIGIADRTIQNYGFQIFQNYPNPFNASTVIAYELAKPEFVTIQIHNLAGQLIASLLSSYQLPGYHTIIWNGTDSQGFDVPSGIYLCLIKVGQKVKINTMTLVR